MKKEKIIEKIYNCKFEELDKIIIDKIKENKINIKDENEKNNIQKSIMMKEMYKQGFIDGVNLILECK